MKKKQGYRLGKGGLQGSRINALGQEVLEVEEEEELADPMISKLEGMNIKSNQDRGTSISAKEKCGKAPVERKNCRTMVGTHKKVTKH